MPQPLGSCSAMRNDRDGVRKRNNKMGWDRGGGMSRGRGRGMNGEGLAH